MPKKTVVTRQEFDPEDTEPTAAEEFAEANPEVTLFTKEEVDDKKVEKLHVTRTDPDEGYLGFLPPHCTEKDIVERWGGSEYQILAKNASGRIVINRKVRLAGDPIFVSEIFEARWRRMMGLKKKDDEKKPDKDPDAISTKDMMFMLRQEEAERRTREREEERERREREKAQDEARRMDEASRFERERARDREFQQAQTAALREAQERQAREQREHELKLEQQRREDSERRDREHARELEKERTAAAALLQQNNTFFQNMLAMTKQQAEAGGGGPDPTTTLIQGMELAMKMNEGKDPKDALTTILERLPETLKEARETASAAYREVSGGGGGATEGGKGDSLTIKGALATKVKSLVRHLVAQGKDPEKVIDGVADYLIASGSKGVKTSPGKPAKPTKGKPAKVAAKTQPQKVVGKGKKTKRREATA